MPLLPTISTIFILISAIYVALGWRFIIKGKKAAHKKAMTLAAVSALLFFVTYLSKTIFIGSTSFGGPESIKIYYTIFLLFHIVLATVSLVFGIITLRLAWKRNIPKHENIGPVTSIIWFGSAVTGVLVYLFLYVIFSGGETTSLIRAILGY
ncbi:DUF420 domain-containing protein [Virgibacillus sp. W0430]|uniref:DUF420 domain-containing protein n=1 Tax=Virgibacillus sp. W0430 TaxID=3391580 RepID=UPI003F48685F